MGDPHRAIAPRCDVVFLFDSRNSRRVPLRILIKKGREISSHDLLTLIIEKAELQKEDSSNLFYQRLFSESRTLTSR